MRPKILDNNFLKKNFTLHLIYIKLSFSFLGMFAAPPGAGAINAPSAGDGAKEEDYEPPKAEVTTVHNLDLVGSFFYFNTLIAKTPLNVPKLFTYI